LSRDDGWVAEEGGGEVREDLEWNESGDGRRRAGCGRVPTGDVCGEVALCGGGMRTLLTGVHDVWMYEVGAPVFRSVPRRVLRRLPALRAIAADEWTQAVYR
jgi:hypothetical protein